MPEPVDQLPPAPVDQWVMYRCRGCGASALDWAEEAVHANNECDGKRPDRGVVDRLILEPIDVDTPT